MNAPKRSHKGLAVSATITCQHVCSLLSKKNLFLTFDDTNGIGTARYLLEQALQNTGWTLKYCETFYEADGVTEKGGGTDGHAHFDPRHEPHQAVRDL